MPQRDECTFSMEKHTHTHTLAQANRRESSSFVKCSKIIAVAFPRAICSGWRTRFCMATRGHMNFALYFQKIVSLVLLYVLNLFNG